MFTQLRVENFKAWQGKREVELAPLSLFLGTNSAGKTSLLQMLLLLKQTAESPDRRQHLNLGGQPGDVLHLGGFRDIISGHDLKRELAFGLSFTGSRTTKQQRVIDYDVSFCQTGGGIPVVKSLTYASGERIFKAERGQKGGYLLTTADSSGPTEQAQSFLSPGEFEPERSVAFSAAAVAALGLEGAKVQDLALQMVEALKGIVYLGPLRERPQRTYLWNQQSPGDLGTKGEFAIQALLASANDRAQANGNGRPWMARRTGVPLAPDDGRGRRSQPGAARLIGSSRGDRSSGQDQGESRRCGFWRLPGSAGCNARVFCAGRIDRHRGAA